MQAADVPTVVQLFDQYRLFYVKRAQPCHGSLDWVPDEVFLANNRRVGGVQTHASVHAPGYRQRIP